MRGSLAKKLRKEIYGDLSFRNRIYTKGFPVKQVANPIMVPLSDGKQVKMPVRRFYKLAKKQYRLKRMKTGRKS